MSSKFSAQTLIADVFIVGIFSVALVWILQHVLYVLPLTVSFWVLAGITWVIILFSELAWIFVKNTRFFQMGKKRGAKAAIIFFTALPLQTLTFIVIMTYGLKFMNPNTPLPYQLALVLGGEIFATFLVLLVELILYLGHVDYQLGALGLVESAYKAKMKRRKAKRVPLYSYEFGNKK